MRIFFQAEKENIIKLYRDLSLNVTVTMREKRIELGKSPLNRIVLMKFLAAQVIKYFFFLISTGISEFIV